jgi:hypothetical protein
VAKNRTLQDGGLETMESARALSGWSEDSDQSEDAYLFYDHLVKSRDRLADLPPLTPQEIERVTLAMHEVVWHLITPPRNVKTPPTRSPTRGTTPGQSRGGSAIGSITSTAVYTALAPNRFKTSGGIDVSSGRGLSCPRPTGALCRRWPPAGIG